MNLETSELETLKSSLLSVQNAKDLANQIEADPTVGGVFPNGGTGDFSNPDKGKFKEKWCDWWPVARMLLIIAKVFTKEKGDRIIDQIISVGDTTCPDRGISTTQ